MSGHRFFVRGLSDVADGAEIDLPDATAQQVTRVLRMRVGATISLFDGSGREWSAEISVAGRAGVRVRLGAAHCPDVEPAVAVHVCPALVPAERLEMVLQKGTELGAFSFRPVLTERVQSRDRNPSSARVDRWRRIVTEAAEQSGRVRAPEVAEPVPLLELVPELARDGPVLLLWEAEERTGLVPVLRGIAARGVESLSLLVGPVGGLSDAEVAQAVSDGAQTARLGRRVLRTETAAITALAIVMAELGQLGA